MKEIDSREKNKRGVSYYLVKNSNHKQNIMKLVNNSLNKCTRLYLEY